MIRITKHNETRGAVLMELALGFPIFLGVVFMIIWIGLTLNARASLGNAMASALRLAATRSNATTTGKEILPVINDWIRSGTTSPPQEIKDLLLINVPEEAPDDYLNRYLSCLFDWDGYQSNTFPGVSISSFRDLPPAYIYALVYLNEALSRSVGHDLKTPCRPNGAGNICEPDRYPSTANGLGCLACRFISPYNPGSGALPLNALPIGQLEWECAYEPDNSVSRPLRAILNFLGGENVSLMTIRRRAPFVTGYEHTPP